MRVIRNCTPRMQSMLGTRYERSNALSFLREAEYSLRYLEDTQNFLLDWPHMPISGEIPVPWTTAVVFAGPMANWHNVEYLYLWFLLSTYHMAIYFEPNRYERWRRRSHNTTLPDLFWNEVFNTEDWTDVAELDSQWNPFPMRIFSCMLVVRFNSRNYEPITQEDNPTSLEWMHDEDEEDLPHTHHGSSSRTAPLCNTARARAWELNTGFYPYQLYPAGFSPQMWRDAPPPNVSLDRARQDWSDFMGSDDDTP